MEGRLKNKLNRREFLATSTLLILGPAWGFRASAQGVQFGVIEGESIPGAVVADCVWVNERIIDLNSKLSEMERSTPSWLSVRIDSFRKDYRNKEKKLVKALRDADSKWTVDAMGAVGEFVGFVAVGIAAVASSPYVVGAALGVVILAPATTLVIQAVLEEPDANAGIKFAAFNAYGRTGFILGQSSKALLRRLSTVMGLSAVAYTGVQAGKSHISVKNFEQQVNSLRTELDKFVRDADYAREVIRQSLKDNLMVLEFLKSLPGCTPSLTPVRFGAGIPISLT